MSENEANTTPTPKRTAQDAYSDFIDKQSERRSLFDTRAMKPVTNDDVAHAVGKK
jgi:hypothetical protein